WRDIAQKGRGAYAAIPQAGGVHSISTPFDRRLHEINRDLVRHTILFGPAARRTTDQKKLAMAGDLPAEAAADRAGCLAREGRIAPFDLLDAIRTGKVTLETLATEELPADMQQMSPRQRREHLARV